MELFLVFGIGLLSTFLGSFVSGGVSMVSVASLTALGLPPHLVLGTHQVGLIGSDIGGLIRYLRSGKILWNLVLPFTLIGLCGAYIGARIVLSLDGEILSKVIGFALLLFIPFSLFKPRLGIVSHAVSQTRKIVGYVGYFLSTIWGASFHVGVGVFILYTQLFFFGSTILETKGTAKIPGFIRNIQTLSLFAFSGFVDWKLGVILLCGMFAGANIGVKYALKIGDTWLRNILLLTIAVLAIKLILGY